MINAQFNKKEKNSCHKKNPPYFSNHFSYFYFCSCHLKKTIKKKNIIKEMNFLNFLTYVTLLKKKFFSLFFC